VNLKHPVKSDLAEAEEVWYYDSDLESNEPWMDTGGSVEDSLDNLAGFTSDKLQKDVVSLHMCSNLGQTK